MIKTDKERSRLLEVWRQLAEAERLTLTQFAEFLLARQGDKPQPVAREPLNLPRPDRESAVKALKRLKKNYPMIDADMGLLDDAARLLMEKVYGTPDDQVIEKMEALFSARYQDWLAGQEPPPSNSLFSKPDFSQ
ncbi:MAG: hypothetical protein HQL67_05915 [Magnetococcales bacterium]|nr:hypothetical protein [Magnetococcales bacterium]